jgi:hypothetical protein
MMRRKENLIGVKQYLHRSVSDKKSEGHPATAPAFPIRKGRCRRIGYERIIFFFSWLSELS